MSASSAEKLAALVELEAAGKLDQETLLDMASDPDHPCHSDFEWDDSAAAHQHRLAQAGRLIVRYRVTIESSERTVTVRKFTRVASEGRWMDGDLAVADHRGQLEEAAMRDARTFVLKHRRLGDETLVEFLSRALDG